MGRSVRTSQYRPGSGCRVRHNNRNSEIVWMAVFSVNFSYMYWSEWGTANSIKKAAMDGTNQIKLVSTVRPATGLTLDYERKRLYWAEKDASTIICTDLDGNDQKYIVKDKLFEPIGLTLYKDFIYWSDNKTGKCHC